MVCIMVAWPRCYKVGLVLVSLPLWSAMPPCSRAGNRYEAARLLQRILFQPGGCMFLCMCSVLLSRLLVACASALVAVMGLHTSPLKLMSV